MAHKKGQGSIKNGRDSKAQRRGVKKFGGEAVRAGNILIRQVGGTVKAGKGVAGRLFQDEELGHRFGEMVADLATLMRKANDPDAGALGAITSDPTMAGDLKIAIANVKDVTEYLTRKDTLWGAIANDPDVGARFRRIMTQVSRAIEDAREAAPIGNFVQVLLGAF